MRTATGTTIVELLVTCMLLAVSFAAIGELMVTNTFASAKLNNKVSGLTAARWAIDRISSDVRCAQSLSISNGGRTLTLEEPISFQDPLNDPGSSSFSNGAAFNQQNGWTVPTTATNPGADTVIYDLVPDNGTYLLQTQRALGLQSLTKSEVRTQINPWQTIVSGIIGPISLSTGQPIIFRPSQTNSGGVSIDLEVQRPNPSGPYPATYEMHSEVFMRVQQTLPGGF